MGCVIKRILQFKEAIIYQPIKIVDFNNIDITRTCMFSWSTDMVCWTGWTTYDNYNTICKNIETDFYLRVLLMGSFEKVFIGENFTTCYSICLDNTNPFLQDFCGSSNLLQPYNNLDCALLLQQQMADSVICMFGLPVYYLRVQPNTDSGSYTFKEYSLHDVIDVKLILLMVPDGEMPSSNPKLTDFDFDWESDWDVEIGKTQFARAFGDNVFPKQRDLVYIPLMKRLWEVNSAYDEKNEGLMWRPTTWKLAMVKYNEKTNVSQGDFESLIDGWTINTYENTFEEREHNEQERLTTENQITEPSFAANAQYENITMSDAVRQEYTKFECRVIDNPIYHKSAVVARNLYTFERDGEVIYLNGLCGDSGVISFIIQTPLGLIDINKNILKFGEVSVGLTNTESGYSLIFNNLQQDLNQNSTYMVALKWNRSTFTTELNIYSYTHRQDIPEYLLKPNMYSFDYENPVCELVGVYNEDYNIARPLLCSISPWPLRITNIKYYNTYLEKLESIKEITKYTTQHENCIINDLARPFNTGLGFAVK